MPGNVTFVGIVYWFVEPTPFSWMKLTLQFAILGHLRLLEEVGMNGYTGKILRVNLSTGKISKENTPTEVVINFVGGRGFGAYFLFKEVPTHADPLGPETN